MSGPPGENLYRPNRWATLGNFAGYSLFLIATTVIATLIATR